MTQILTTARLLFGLWLRSFAPTRIPASRVLSDWEDPAGWRRAAVTGSDGRRLQRHDGSGPVRISRVDVAIDSDNGEVRCTFTTNGTPSDAVDVASAEANLTGVNLGVITDPLGVVPSHVFYVGADEPVSG